MTAAAVLLHLAHDHLRRCMVLALLLGVAGPLLLRGIRTKLFTLPDDTVVHPGHGGPTTVGAEKRDNPFVGLG